MKKQHSRLGLISLAAFALLSAAPAALGPRSSAAAPPAGAPILLHLSAEKQTAGAEGQTHWAAVTDVIQPGDSLRYTLQVQSRSASAVHDLVVTQPIPAGMTYQAASATGSPTYSLNGKTFSAVPTVPVRQSDGTVQERPAAPETFRALRWRFAEVDAHSVQSVTYQVKVR